MQSNQKIFSVRLMCQALEVSSSGFYAWQNMAKQRMQREERREFFDTNVRSSFIRSKERSGAPRLVKDLREQGIVCSRKKVAKSMQKQGLRAKSGRRRRRPGYSSHTQPVAENILNRDIVTQGPNKKWVSDITYVQTQQGFVYWAVVIDLFSRKVIGWAMSDTMEAKLVCDALEMALSNRGYPTGVLIHSDQGSQYCSRQYQDLLKRYRMVCSMSRKGNCHDNACAESFFGSAKVEALHGKGFRNREEAMRVIFEYVEVDYNRTRRHSALGYVSPVTFEETHFLNKCVRI